MILNLILLSDLQLMFLVYDSDSKIELQSKRIRPNWQSISSCRSIDAEIEVKLSQQPSLLSSSLQIPQNFIIPLKPKSHKNCKETSLPHYLYHEIADTKRYYSPPWNYTLYSFQRECQTTEKSYPR